MSSTDDEIDWPAIHARSAAFTAMSSADLEGATLLEKAEFLDRLGLPRSETAMLLGTTTKSLKELERQRRLKEERA